MNDVRTKNEIEFAYCVDDASDQDFQILVLLKWSNLFSEILLKYRGVIGHLGEVFLRLRAIYPLGS
jgi:hypothetical protein